MANRSVPPALDAPWPLVGRDEVLGRAIAAITGSRARIVVLTGEPGSGKTRISSETTAAAARAGDLVVAIHGNPVLSAVPLGVAGPLLPLDALPEDAGALFTAVRAHLLALAEGRRVVLLVEAVSILDSVTTALVAQLTAARVVTLLATVRTGEPLPDALSAQWSPDDCTRIDIPPLSVAQAGELLEAALGGQVAWHVVEDLHTASGGNPLYLRELVIGAVASGRLTAVAGSWQLTGDPVTTPALHDLVLAHVRRFDDAERDVVERLAVCGELPVAHLTAPGAVEALERLERMGVIAVEPGAVTTRIAQPQYASVVRDGLSVLRVAAIARDQSERLAAEARPEYALRIALLHLDAGIRIADDDLLAAAESAARTHDHRTVERLTAGADLTDPRLLLVRGVALSRLGRVPESLDALRAAAGAVGDGDRSLVVRIASATAFAAAIQVDGIPSGLDALDALPAELAADPDVRYLRATMLLSALRVDEALDLLTTAEAALTATDTGRILHARTVAAALSARGDDEAALASIRGALATSAGPGVPRTTLEGTLAQVLLQAGRFGEAFDAGIRSLHLATAGNDQFALRGAELTLGRIELERGRLESAARWFREVVGGALARGPLNLAAPAAGGLALVRLAQGDDAAAAEALALVPAGAPARTPSTVLAAGVTAARAGDLPAAAKILLTAARELSELGHRFHAGADLFMLARWGDPAAAADELERLVAAGAGELTALQARHARAEASGDRAALVTVGDDWERRGSNLYAAEAFASAARLAQAAGESRAATGLQARSDSLGTLTQGATTPLLRFRAVLVPLTTREREIAAFAAQGTSSKDIAARLYLSARTVDNHLQSIYGKLGIRGRGELADAIG